MLALDLVQTRRLCRRGPVRRLRHQAADSAAARYNIPAPVVGGLLCGDHDRRGPQRRLTLVSFDTTLQTPLMNAFFASVGFGASVRCSGRRPAGP